MGLFCWRTLCYNHTVSYNKSIKSIIMDVAQLPGPGPEFMLNDPHVGFKHKLTLITFKDEYRNIRNSVDLIVDALEPYLEIIKRGGLDRGNRLHIWEKIRSADRNLSRWDMELVTKILEHLSH
jgi:hypothetical protein